MANQKTPGTDLQVSKVEQLQHGTEGDIVPKSGYGLYLLQQVQHRIEPNNIESDVLELGQLQQDVKSHKVEDQVKLARFHLGK